MTDPTQARDRVRRKLAGEPPASIYDTEDSNESLGLYRDDMTVIVADSLRMNETTPLSPEVLERFGFKKPDPENDAVFSLGGLEAYRIASHAGQNWSWFNLCDGDVNGRYISEDIAPRNVGELRCLLKRLEVPYEEKSND